MRRPSRLVANHTFDWNQLWNLTIPVRLQAGSNTMKFIANPQYNWDSTSIGVIYSGQGIDQITLAPFQLRHRGE
jgi:hypothetical protein